MPMASYAASTWELGSFRAQSTGTSIPSPILGPDLAAPAHGSVGGPGSASAPVPPPTRGSLSGAAAGPSPAATTPTSSHGSSLGDTTISPKSRGSFSGAMQAPALVPRGSLSLGSNTLVGSSRNSLSSFASIGSLASQGLPASLLDDAKPASASTGVFGAPAPAQASLVVSNLAREFTPRDCQLLFALAPELVSSDTSRNAVSSELTIYAKFSSVHAAHAVAQTLERMPELLGSKVKVSVQTLGANASAPINGMNGVNNMSPSGINSLNGVNGMSMNTAQMNSAQMGNQRSIYPARPLFAESYWSSQPVTPMSPLGQTPTTELFSSSRSASIVSPTDPFVPPAQAMSPAMLGGSPGAGGVGLGGIPDMSVADPAYRQARSHNGSSSSIGSASSPPGSGMPHTLHRNSAGTVSSVGSGSGSRPSLGAGPLPPQSLRRMPPQNPADQNPPCNTLYVGNLPPDTSEAELKELFSTQPGYRRLCFRAKQNGPMCFVEFEDELLAGRALDELYGVSLSNSVKGGIRLSYSKNPLGVRSCAARPK